MVLPRLPGEPEQVRAGADRVCETASLILRCSDTLARLVDGAAGTSRGLDTAVARGRVVVPRLRQAAERYRVAGAALVDFAAEQDAAIQAADLAILRHERAGEELAALLAADVGEEEDSAHEAALAEAREEQAAALAAYHRARRDLDEAGDRADRLIEEVVRDSPLNDSVWDDLRGAGDDVFAAVDGAREAVIASAWSVELLLEGLSLTVGDAFGGHPRRVPDDVQAAAYLDYLTRPGRQADVDELFQLACSSYRGQGAPDGWERMSQGALLAHGIRVGDEDGFAATVFRKDGRVVVAYRGTAVSSVADWAQNLQNSGHNETSQGRQAVELAGDVVAAFGRRSVGFTGHSMGGSLAAQASVATGSVATTFNAAGIGKGNWANAVLAGGEGAGAEHVVNFSTANDVLTGVQTATGSTPAAGAQVTVTSSAVDPVSGHGIAAFPWYRSVTESRGMTP